MTAEEKDLNKKVRDYGGKYLKGVGLKDGAEIKLKIAAVRPPNTVMAGDEKLIPEPILVFEKTELEMTINHTNHWLLQYLFGPDATDWIGNTATVGKRYLKEVKMLDSKDHACLRIIPPIGTKLPRYIMKHMGQKERYFPLKQ